MRKIVTAIMGTISGLVLLFSYHTSTSSEAATTTGGTDTGTASQSTATPSASASATPSASASAEPSSSSSSSGSGSGSTSGTYTGDAVETRWGTVQVQITVENGQITSADAIQYPNENGKDQQINAYAIPQLNAEVVEAQSANIDTISGATVTSDGYLQSLQSAIDAAHL